MCLLRYQNVNLISDISQRKFIMLYTRCKYWTSNPYSAGKIQFVFSMQVQICLFIWNSNWEHKGSCPRLLFCLISAHFVNFILYSMHSYVRPKLMHIISLEACHFKCCLSREYMFFHVIKVSSKLLLFFKKYIKSITKNVLSELNIFFILLKLFIYCKLIEIFFFMKIIFISPK